jgi:hypothetical protein
MLQLESARLVGKGLHRECYEYPGDPTRCIKVVVAGNSDENRREARYYALLAARGISWEMLSRFYGLEDTSMGLGAVFELIRDHDGGVSHTLEQYLARPGANEGLGETLSLALPALRAYLLRDRVVTMTLKSKNILLQMTTGKSGRLVIVDNVGNSDFIPLSNSIGLLARAKIRRKWRRFEADLLTQNPDNMVLRRILRK